MLFLLGSASFTAKPACFVYINWFSVFLKVIAGSGLDVGFALISPSGYRMVSEFRRSDGIHVWVFSPFSFFLYRAKTL